MQPKATHIWPWLPSTLHELFGAFRCAGARVLWMTAGDQPYPDRTASQVGGSGWINEPRRVTADFLWGRLRFQPSIRPVSQSYHVLLKYLKISYYCYYNHSPQPHSYIYSENSERSARSIHSIALYTHSLQLHFTTSISTQSLANLLLAAVARGLRDVYGIFAVTDTTIPH